jgi:hypothetical protein
MLSILLYPQDGVSAFLQNVGTTLTTDCWIDETALNLVPFIAIFNLGNKKKSQPALNQGSRVDGITWGSLISPKTRRQCLKDVQVHCRAEDTRTHFPETQD